MLRLTMLTLFCLAIALKCVAAEDASQQLRKRAMKYKDHAISQLMDVFKKADSNKDGDVSLKELAKRISYITRQFKETDAIEHIIKQVQSEVVDNNGTIKDQKKARAMVGFAIIQHIKSIAIDKKIN